ncbi:MAG: SDR family NAD(P)-dependent oxidoreductase [Cylindrospermopsis raciborskii 1523720]|uniref:SDR family NAD(P)-dependent oxidoreductase n=2 Tax=Cylindrospermopsis raciborskii TaxID=77022 RepID=UPI002B467569|nr:SDR family NAD(P)-dependent oxidoreductase [Cylindrospermopsis raciborskii]MEB3146682.1 SDR family NAD(P)-dependent oxidoreductase [Cylindrospermopsis raciborskii]
MNHAKLESDLAQLQDEVSKCERDLLNLIKGKKTMEYPQNHNGGNQSNQIAIIGMASLFPQSKNLQEYWQVIVDKIDCIMDVPASRWSVEDYYDPNPKAPDKTYCKRGGFIPDIDFNPMEFGLPPNILEVTDISQLLGLVVAKAAMEDAGYGESQQFDRDRTGVILGVAIGRQLAVPLGSRLQYPVWKKVFKNCGLSDDETEKVIEKLKSAYIQWEENAFPGMLANVISGRIANRLDLGGTNCVVDAACASSLGALNMAISELLAHRADMMITGGVDTDNSIFAYMCFSKTPAVSPSEKVRPFDVNSDGMMLGEGVGMLVLKRLEDAVKDGDRIYAVVKGIGSSSDGKYKSIYAPHSQGQVKAIRRAYENAGFAPQTVGLIEAHGTGTMVGDPTEFTSINQVFGNNNSLKQHIALGTVKSQIGHTKAAAGAASLIKTALALYHKVLPPTINITQPHPKLNIENSPFYLNTETRPWISNQPRRAGVSAFGFGGTNYHVVLEEYESEHHQSYRLHNCAKSIILAAPTSQELLSHCQHIYQQLESTDQEQHYQKIIAESEQSVIPTTYARVGFTTLSLNQAIARLAIIIDWLKNQPSVESWEHPQGIYYRQQGMETTGKVVALFSGQGSQYLEMGRELVINFPCLRQTYSHLDDLFSCEGLEPLSQVVFPTPVFTPQERQEQLEKLQRTEYAQPAIGVLSAGLYKILQQAGLQVDFVAGHSFGELTALWSAGVFSEEDYLFLVKARGKAMSTSPEVDAGGMLAVKGNITQVTELIKHFPQVAIANYNSPQQIVLAGNKSEITQLQNVLQAQGFSCFLLGVSAAFHTPLVSHAQKPFAHAIAQVNFQPPGIPVYSNVTGELYPNEPASMQKILQEHLLNQVLFQQQIKNIYQSGGNCFIEFGPKNVLTNLVKEILVDKPHVAVALNANYRQDSDLLLREAVTKLRVFGVPLKNLDPYQVPAKISSASQKNQQKTLNIRLNATNINDRSQKAFAQALATGSVIKMARVENSQIQPEKIQKTLVETSTKINPEISSSSIFTSPIIPINHSLVEPKMEISLDNYDRVLNSLEQSLVEFTRQQSEVNQVHEQSLQNQIEYNKTFYELMRQQSLFLAQEEINEYQSQTQQLAIASTERSMMRLHDHQAETIRIHEKYLNYQQEYTNNYFQLLEQHYSLLEVGSPSAYSHLPSSSHLSQVPAQKLMDSLEPENNSQNNLSDIGFPTHIDKEKLRDTLINIVSDKTGYPVEMLDLSMDIEADLGIDSIKRVEILGGLLELYPDLPRPNPEELAQLATLEQIAEYINNLITQLGQNQPIEQTATTETPLPVTEDHNHPQLLVLPHEDLLDRSATITIPDNLSQLLLTIVSDKTGYPVEMLDLSMDMEADLGIDSIKRVEILGGLLELYPDLPRPNPEELAQLRTLGEIAEYMRNQAETMERSNLSTSEKSDTSTTEVADKILCLPVQLKPLPQPDSLDLTIPENHFILITNDGSEVTHRLVAKLTDKGCKTVVLTFPCLESNLSEEITQIRLNDWHEETLQEHLNELTTKFGPVGGFIHLHPYFNHNSNNNLGIDQAIVQHVFLIAKHLKEDLNQLAKKERACFFAVVRLDGELGTAKTHNFSPISGGLFGLTKSLNQEWPEVFCRTLDLSPDLDADTTVKHILAELQDPNLLITEVGYNKTDRFTLVAEPGKSSIIPDSLNITKNQVFVVSGGAKGITAKCVIKLAEEYQCKFILLGRSSAEIEPVWSEGYEDENELKRRIMEDFLAKGEKPSPIMVQKKYQTISSQREIHNTLKAITEAGGKAEYVCVDITDGMMLREKLTPIIDQFGTITGIIHGAGNLADKRIEKKTVQDFETVYAAKVQGLENLLHIVERNQLEYLILFSSVVGFYGNVGQTDYAIANEILNKSAHVIKHKHPNCHVVSINWGPWDSGMVSPELQTAFAQRGIKTIPQELGSSILVDQLRNSDSTMTQVVIGSPLVYIPSTLSSELKTHQITRQLKLNYNPFLQDHVIAGNPVLPATCGLSWISSSCEQLYPGFQTFHCPNFKVLKGIVFDQNSPHEYILEIQEVAKIDNQEIQLAGKISSVTNHGKIRYHFSSNLILKRQIPPADNYEFFNLTQDGQFLASNSLLYQTGGGSLFHGNTFQGVKSVLNISPGKLTMKCELPEPTLYQQGQFTVQTLNPYIADVQIHSLWIWTQHFHQVGCLPSEIENFEQFVPVPFGETFYVTCEIKSKTESYVVADVITHNQKGQVYNRMNGAKGTILPNSY